VHASAEEFERAILNLLRNAVEAQEQAAEGGRIRIVLQSAARDELVLTIEDAGPGLPEGVVAALHGSGPEALPEPGLGLAISWGIVLSAGGGLRALHDGEHGACLEIRLPVAHRA
jgi:C4-dicarboxylate-specific signal transduction histidine kinase